MKWRYCMHLNAVFEDDMRRIPIYETKYDPACSTSPLMHNINSRVIN